MIVEYAINFVDSVDQCWRNGVVHPICSGYCWGNSQTTITLYQRLS